MTVLEWMKKSSVHRKESLKGSIQPVGFEKKMRMKNQFGLVDLSQSMMSDFTKLKVQNGGLGLWVSY